MLALLVQSLLFLHVAAGITTLVSGPFAIFYNWNNAKAHRRAGKVFLYAMLVVCITSVITFARHPEKVFYQFLFGLAWIVLAGVVRGVRAIFLMKGAKTGHWIDMAIVATTAISGSIMVKYGLDLLAKDGVGPFSILFCVFGMGGMMDAYGWWRKTATSIATTGLDWLMEHKNSMLGAFMASTTAFTVNVGQVLPWYAQWFGPTLLLLPVSIYFGRKIKQKRMVVAK
jgi:hypothetical protein